MMLIRRSSRSFFKLLLLFGLPYSTAMSSNKTYQFLEKIVGYENRKNDVLFFPNLSNSLSNKIVYYFGGDIQDLPERMEKSSENHRYQRWNLVSTGEILCGRFLDSSIAIIRPNEMKDGTFSRFSNFVPSTTEYGDPLSYDTTHLIGLRHLRALDEQISQQTTSTSDITLIGFSKGCVVLNQLLHELTALTGHALSKFSSRIRRIIWLDGGHNNGERVMIWPTDENLVSTLSRLQIQVEVYVTPFQINSSNPYKTNHTQQYHQFSELLLRHSNNLPNYQNKIFFLDQTASIEKHFELLSTL